MKADGVDDEVLNMTADVLRNNKKKPVKYLIYSNTNNRNYIYLFELWLL